MEDSDGWSKVLSNGDTPRNNSLEDFVRNRSIIVLITVLDGDDGLVGVVYFNEIFI